MEENTKPDNVIGLRGSVPKRMGIVDEDVVRQLEDLLERARAGELNGIAVAMHYGDGTSNRCFVGVASWSLVGRCFELQGVMQKTLQK